jgi:signal transduction histidine kinase
MLFASFTCLTAPKRSGSSGCEMPASKTTFAALFDPIPAEYRALAPAFESEAISYLWERLLVPLGVVGALSMLAFGVMDWWLYPQHLLSLWALRLFGLILPYSAVAVIAHYGRRRIHPYLIRNPYLLGMGLQIVLSVTVGGMLVAVGDWTSPYWLLLLMATFFAGTVPWPTVWALRAGLIAAVMYLGVSLFLGGWAQNPAMMVFFNLALFSTLGLTLGAVHRPLLILRWQNFLRQHQLAEARAALETANQALQQNIVELEASNAELDAFAHTVAHDLKNPIGALIGFSSLLESRLQNMPAEKAVSTLQRVTAAGYKLARIVDELLLLASVRKMEQVQKGVLDMALIVAEAQERLADMIANTQADIIVPTTWPEALGYAPWVEEVWTNYLSNALKYGGAPPRVELGYSIFEAGGQSSTSSIQFWVQDNGPGLTTEQQSRLFTQFTRLHQVRIEGHGLGLSIVQRIVAKLGGAVGVESAVGQGSRFWFALPLSE